jgi:hypothetical protein
MLDMDTRKKLINFIENEQLELNEFKELVKKSLIIIKIKDVLLPPTSATLDKFRR